MMERDRIYASYVISLAWTTLLLFIAGCIINTVKVLQIFFRGTLIGPEFVMLLDGPLLFGMIAMGGTLLVFAVPQIVQAILAHALVRSFDRRGLVGVVLALPLTVVLTWYCYDYLTPSMQLSINEGPDWQPWQHGLTIERYLTTLAVQAPITLFGVLHCDAAMRDRSTNSVVVAALYSVIAFGVVWGLFSNTILQIWH
jgi:hypothetical protein